MQEEDDGTAVLEVALFLLLHEFVGRRFVGIFECRVFVSEHGRLEESERRATLFAGPADEHVVRGAYDIHLEPDGFEDGCHEVRELVAYGLLAAEHFDGVVYLLPDAACAVIFDVVDFSLLQHFENGLHHARGTLRHRFVFGILLIDLEGVSREERGHLVEDMRDGVHVRGYPYGRVPLAILDAGDFTAVHLHGVYGHLFGGGVEEDFVVVFERVGFDLDVRLRRGRNCEEGVVVELVGGCEHDFGVGVEGTRDGSRIGESLDPGLDHHLFPAAGS